MAPKKIELKVKLPMVICDRGGFLLCIVFIPEMIYNYFTTEIVHNLAVDGK